MIIDVFPDRAPRGGPNGTVTCMNLYSIVGEFLFDLQNGGPKDRLCSSALSCPKGGIRIVFSLEDS
jgi:hypothetical protein